MPGGDASTLSYALVKNGLDVELPGKVRAFGRDNSFSLYAMSLYFVSDLRFRDLVSSVAVSGAETPDRGNAAQWEAGFTFGSADEPLQVAGPLRIRRLGLGFRWGHRFRGVRLVGGFPF